MMRQSSTLRTAADRVMQSMLIATLSVLLPLGASAAPTQPPEALRVLISGTAHEALFAVAFSGSKGIAVGSAGAILASSDSGKTWKHEATDAAAVTLLGVDISGEHAIAVGQQGLILRREGGKWIKSNSGSEGRLFAVSVNSKGQALAVGAFGVVLKSDDSGASWQSVPPTWTTYSDVGVDPHLYAAQVDEAGALTLAGEFGLILHSTDGGKHWAPEHKGDASIFALQLREDGVGYAVGQSGLVLRTADHGVTWTTLTSGSTAILLGVDALPNGHVVASGMHDMIESKDDGKTWTHVISPDASTSWYEGVGTATESGSFIAVGHSGRIVDVGG
ncbi:MAG: photosystem stability/assembly factor-like protein [Nevskia sp.]|nr:photosystem stability/assembly factor-like protein [Nevskia sp.]